MRIVPTVLIIALLASCGALAQVRRAVGGTVTASDGSALIGATVRVFGVTAGDSLVATRYGAITDASGRFELSLARDSSYAIEVSYVGYETERVAVGPLEGDIAIELEEGRILRPLVEVRATRRTRSVEDACCRVESIREEVQQHAPFSPSAVDVLRRYSSCTSTRVACALDNSQSIRLRGLEPTYINVLVDGMPAISGLGTMYGLGMIPAHALQTIRIAEGASSGLYGNGAISGIVDLQTRQPTEMPELMVSGNVSDHEIGFPGERDLNVSYTGLVGDVGIAAFGSFNVHDRGMTLPGDYDRIAGLVKGNVLLDGATEITLRVLGGREHRESSIRIPLDLHERVNTSRGDLSATFGHTFADESELQASALVSLMDIDGVFAGPTLDASQRIAYGNVTYLRAVGEHLLTIGVEARDDRLAVADGPAIGYETTVASAFLQDELALSDEWTIMGSARIDHHDGAGTIVSPRGSLKFEPIANMTMRLMAGSGFKGQAYFDETAHRALHGDQRWVANDAFGFERSFTLNYDVSYSFVLGTELGVDANFNTYYTTIRGKAIPHADSLAAGALFMINSDEPARLTGLELQLRPSFGEHWSGSIALSLIDYRMRTEGGSYERIALAPSLNLDASLMYHDRESGVAIEAWGSHVGSQRLLPTREMIAESPAYTLLNARFEKTFGIVSAYFGINNIFDQTQSDTMPLVYFGETHTVTDNIWGPIEGREGFVGFRLTFGGSSAVE